MVGSKLGRAVRVQWGYAVRRCSDGKRVVAATYAGGATQQNSGHVIFLENFVDELQRKAPLSDK